jgi:hypothetical protein
MKKTIAIFVISTMLVACGSTVAKVKYVPEKPDTVKVLGTYVNIPYKETKMGVMFLIIKDAINVDSFLTAKKVKDTIPLFLPDGDSLFKQTIMPAICLDTNLDSCFAKLARWKKLNDKFLKDKPNEKNLIGGAGTVSPNK